MSRLSKIQQELKVSKNQYNQFGGYHYRSAEDIIETVKPLLGDCVLTLSDEIVQVGDRIYVRATVTFREGDVSTSVTAWARESDQRKGMDPAQLTGACSSYARKYALGGLFLCDDQKDADTMKPPQMAPPAGQPPQEPTPWDPPAVDHTPDASPKPAPTDVGRIPAPSPDQRKWLTALWDYYQSIAEARKLDKQKLLRLVYLHMNRYPGSMPDVDLAKKWIKVEELCA